jgi:hypothetical protein
MRVLIDNQVVYDGAPVPVPRVGDTVQHDGETRSVEAVTWELADNSVSVTLLLADRPYAY